MSIEDNNKSKVSVYPNPTNGRLYISGLNNVERLEVFSIEGKLLKRFTTVNEYVDLDIASGLYMVKLTDNGRTIIKKVIKE